MPEDVVEAAFAQCDALEYTGPGNCSAIADLPDGLVTVATAAGEYNPWFYAVIGFPTQTFSGAGTDYAMRVLSALICAGGICAAAGALSQRAAGAWTRLGFVMALSPVLVYSTVVPAPNAIEMVAGLCVWTGLLGMTQAHAKRERNWCLALATLAAVVLAVTRTLGPLWLALIVVTVVAFEGVRRTRETMRAAPGQIALAAALVGLSVAGAGLWLATAGPSQTSLDSGGPSAGDAAGGADWLKRVVAWTFQLVGAFPYRNEPAPIGVYALYFGAFAGLFVLAVMAGTTRQRRVILLACAATFALPIVITVATSDTEGVVWQGRYGLPYFVGFPVLAGLSIDQALRVGRERHRTVRILTLSAVGVSQAWCVVHVLIKEQARAVSVADGAWLNPPALALGVLAAAGAALLVLAAWGPTGERAQSRPSENADSRSWRE